MPECTRQSPHQLIFFFQVKNNHIAKIGQTPSLADPQNHDLNKYRKILGEDRYAEFNRAVGLSAHGVGIGAFVYLRRVFEDLIEESHKVAREEADWDEEEYQRSRMDEKIHLLRSHLPDLLYEYRGTYSILSKGVHDLSEEEYLEYFEPVKVAVELILDQKLEQQRREKKKERAKKSIRSIKTELGMRDENT